MDATKEITTLRAALQAEKVISQEHFDYYLKEKARVGLLRAALVGLVGVDGRADLEQMEGVMRLMPAAAQDKAVTIDAIHALIATLDPAGATPAESGVTGSAPPSSSVGR